MIKTQKRGVKQSSHEQEHMFSIASLWRAGCGDSSATESACQVNSRSILEVLKQYLQEAAVSHTLLSQQAITRYVLSRICSESQGNRECCDIP